MMIFMTKIYQWKNLRYWDHRQNFAFLIKHRLWVQKQRNSLKIFTRAWSKVRDFLKFIRPYPVLGLATLKRAPDTSLYYKSKICLYSSRSWFGPRSWTESVLDFWFIFWSWSGIDRLWSVNPYSRGRLGRLVYFKRET